MSPDDFPQYVIQTETDLPPSISTTHSDTSRSSSITISEPTSPPSLTDSPLSSHHPTSPSLTSKPPPSLQEICRCISAGAPLPTRPLRSHSPPLPSAARSLSPIEGTSCIKLSPRIENGDGDLRRGSILSQSGGSGPRRRVSFAPDTAFRAKPIMTKSPLGKPSHSILVCLLSLGTFLSFMFGAIALGSAWSSFRFGHVVPAFVSASLGIYCLTYMVKCLRLFYRLIRRKWTVSAATSAFASDENNSPSSSASSCTDSGCHSCSSAFCTDESSDVKDANL